MNSILQGERIVVGDHALVVDADGRVLAGTDRPAAGDGVARAIARLVDDTVATDAPERGITVDQTNTSVIIDERLIVKLVGRWSAADRAAALLEQLAAAGSEDVDRFVGRVEWRHPSLGTSTLAVVTEYLPGAVDGWTWAVDDVVAALDGGPEPEWPALLGERVARIHGVLGEGAQRSETDAPTARADRASTALRSALRLSSGDAGARLRNRHESLARDIRSLGATAPGVEFPIHGDLHVGQVLRSPGADAPRYTVIDFDGDPQLAAEEREAPDAAARDIAHMLVSFDLVAAVAQKRLQRADARTFELADRARRDFLDAYRAHVPSGELLDETLLPGFEAEQLVAELRYADRFLPAWIYAPDAAITHRHPSTNEHPEEPWTPPLSEPISS
ncbi:hypothetical protein ASE14_12990 [Agromyces sp. Root81]|uniref:hypothetical protein n=1 Tax=Agromyces sp. Root81 TaxID=1736601 RepID=UPI0006FF5945|nr:hypothetical protein [Agromyces sp. Root81]KRC61736.1 hypothetical protein ASE14_12990 [Agromyces sp. Root81]